MKSSVKIGPSFFANELKEYDNWHWAFIREAIQNSVDAKGSDRVGFEVSKDGDDTIVAWANNGEPMSEDIIVNKLFSLGESGKRFNGSVGGFGKAKILLYFTHTSYVINTGGLTVTGSGADYEVVGSDDQYYGTKSIVRISGDHVEQLKRQIRILASFMQWPGILIMNGEVLECNHNKGSRRRDLGFGVVYTNKSHSNKCVVRINGIPMFHQYCGHDRLVLVELVGASDTVLTASRDGLLYPYRGELSNFITELTVDKKSALKDRSRGPKYVQYRGSKLCHSNALNVVSTVMAPSESRSESRSEPPSESPSESPSELVAALAGVSVAGDEQVNAPVVSGGFGDRSTVPGGCAPSYSGVGGTVKSVVTLGSNFILKNETDLKVPAYYDPGSGEFSTYSHKLVRIWGRIMLELHRLFDVEAEFSIGFVFDESSAAQCETGNFGLVYYLNPADVVEQNSSNSKSFKKRFKLTDRDKLIAIGAHEFVHALGYQMHCERYAAKFTDVIGTVMQYRNRFNWCFR